MNCPAIKPLFSIVAHGVDCVELRSGVWNTHNHVLQDHAKNGSLLDIVKSLNGKLTVGDIAKKFNIKRSEIEGVIDQLNHLGVVEFSPASAFDSYIAHFDMSLKKYCSGPDFKHSILLLGENEVSCEIKKLLENSLPAANNSIVCEDKEFLEFHKNLHPQIFHDGLAFERLLTRFEKWRHHLVVLVQRFVDPIAAHYLNRICHALEIPWMHVAMDGPFIFIGPIFTGKGACYDCFETRILMNIKQQESYLRYKEALAKGAVFSPATPLSPVLSHLMASHAAMEIINYCLTQSAFVVRKALSIYIPLMEMTYNEVLQLSGCETCGSIGKRDDQQLYFDVQSLLK